MCKTIDISPPFARRCHLPVNVRYSVIVVYSVFSSATSSLESVNLKWADDATLGSRHPARSKTETRMEMGRRTANNGEKKKERKCPPSSWCIVFSVRCVRLFLFFSSAARCSYCGPGSMWRRPHRIECQHVCSIYIWITYELRIHTAHTHPAPSTHTASTEWGMTQEVAKNSCARCLRFVQTASRWLATATAVAVRKLRIEWETHCEYEYSGRPNGHKYTTSNNSNVCGVVIL